MRDKLIAIDRLLDEGEVLAAARLVVTADLEELPRDVNVLNQRRAVEDALAHAPDQLASLLRGFVELARKDVKMERTIFLVHGWDAELKWEAKNYFGGILGAECVILHEQSGDGGTLIDKFERHAARCCFAVVLLSDRDGGGENFASPDGAQQPRPNVLFEMGYFFAKLGRAGVLLLRRGDVEVNTDVLGIEWIDVTNGVESAGESIRRRMPWLKI